jgi:hypothetical protein
MPNKEKLPFLKRLDFFGAPV